MTAAPVSRYPVPRLEDMPEDIRARIEKVQEKSGFIPNVFLMLAYRPEEFRAFMAYHDALMDKPGALTKAEREMIVVATSNANQCHFASTGTCWTRCAPLARDGRAGPTSCCGRRWPVSGRRPGPAGAAG